MLVYFSKLSNIRHTSPGHKESHYTLYGFERSRMVLNEISNETLVSEKSRL